jgi:hypothetical protein
MLKKRGLLAVMVAVLLAVAVPTAAMAAGPKTPFAATGTVEFIDEGNVDAAGNSGRFVVRDRTVAGTFSGDLAGPYTFVFDTNVPLLTQSGQVHGTLSAGGRVANVRGSSNLAGGPRIALHPLFGPVPYAAIAMGGKLTFTQGSVGNGNLSAVAWVMLDLDGHNVGILPAGVLLLDFSFTPVGVSGASEVSVSGVWAP